LLKVNTMLILSLSETQEVGFNIPSTYYIQHVSWRIFSRFLSLNYHHNKIHLKYNVPFRYVHLKMVTLTETCSELFIY
jgi:hypothetical protein